MKFDLQHCIVVLPPGQGLRLCAAAGVTIRCDGGVLWVTQEGRARDDFLSAGESLGVTSAGVTLVEAMGDSAAQLTLRARQAPQGAIRMFQASAAF
jgi:Protein of unknown function (DUF2917)